MPLNVSSVKRPAAFLGNITRQVRDLAVHLYTVDGQGTALDVACGNGLFFASLRDIGPGAVGSDLDGGLLREARDVFRDNGVNDAGLVKADAARLPFLDESFDKVFFLNTLINIPDDGSVAKILTELYRVCRGGGRAYFDIRNGANWLLRARYALHNLKSDFVTRSYALRTVEGIATEAGFEETVARPVHSRLPFRIVAYLVEARRTDR